MYLNMAESYACPTNDSGSSHSDSDQVNQDQNNGMQEAEGTNQFSHSFDDIHYGFDAIDRACRNLYPEPHNPAMISSPAIKMWEGGVYPLDYVKVFLHAGQVGLSVPPHWHFVTYGLTDLYGDGRVHQFTGRHEDSGYGFELTFRLLAGEGSEPPEWPITLLNNLARYVFNTGVGFREFDHIPWHGPLDRELPGGDINKSLPVYRCQSEVNAMLVVEDPELPCLDTPHGQLTFLQVVGITDMEFLYARSWKSRAVVDKLLDHPQVGPLLVTDADRKLSIFDVDLGLLADFHDKMEEEGTNLGRVTAHVRWSVPEHLLNDREPLGLLKDTLGCEVSDDHNPPVYRVDTATAYFEPGAAELLPLMVKGRLRHGSSFTLASVGCPRNVNLQAIQFVPEGEDGHLVNRGNPMVVVGGLLQIMCTEDTIREMSHHFSSLELITKSKERLPLEYVLSQLQLTVHVMMFPARHTPLVSAGVSDDTVQVARHTPLVSAGVSDDTVQVAR
ncbi:suppressor of fused homolog, partial [Aplysia californica]|uniref:Suppressor of fused homolog n=1 Tax=Aplysia californica TaxID=6500 RepID=A0ABM0KB45_APLCA